VTYLDWGLFGLMFLLAAREAMRPRSRRNLLGWAVLAALFLWSWPPFTALFAYSLERWYPPTRFPDGDAEAIVVLGGGVYPVDASQPEPLPLYDTFLRCQHAAWLYRNWKALPVIASGGVASGSTGPVIAEIMRRTLVEAGVPDAMIRTEVHSKSTYENALFTARLLREKQIRRVALVTEAYHLPRAVQCFQKQGIDVIPAGCDYRHLRLNARWTQLFPSAQMILFNEESLHEWAGIAWYRLSGKT
jgi:uncharacterized SAM-binding protein YcdF (DUF218 family)